MDFNGGNGKVTHVKNNIIVLTYIPGCCDEGENAKTVCFRLFDTAGSQTPSHVEGSRFRQLR